MIWLRITFLTFVLVTTSGYGFRCKWMCTDQTAIQEDYIERRDRCRELAQLKVDTSSAPLDDNARKSQLTSYFNECMVQNGWTMPENKEKAAAAAVAAPVAAAGAAGATAAAAALPAPPNPAEQKASLTHSSECAFAHQSADVSSISAKRAKACDLECEQALKAAPEAPRPAACPPVVKDSLSEGSDTQ